MYKRQALGRPAELVSAGHTSVGDEKERKDRSGFGQGGDRSGRAAADDNSLVCAVYESPVTRCEHPSSALDFSVNTNAHPDVDDACLDFQSLHGACDNRSSFTGHRLGPSCYVGSSESHIRCRRFATPPSPRRSVGFCIRKLIYHVHMHDVYVCACQGQVHSVLPRICVG